MNLGQCPDSWLIRYIDGTFEGYWRANSSGYTTDIIAAGVYSEADAKRLATRFEDRAVSLRDALKGLSSNKTVASLIDWVPR